MSISRFIKSRGCRKKNVGVQEETAANSEVVGVENK